MYRPEGVCSQKITVELDGGIIRAVCIDGGCDGNLKGLARLLEGADARATAVRLRGVTCGRKATSCPDQLAKALEQALAAETQEVAV